MADEGGKRRSRDEEPEQLSRDELERARGEVLPDRQAMSVIQSDVAIPLDPQLAASVLSGDPGAPGEGASAGGEPAPGDDAPGAEGGDPEGAAHDDDRARGAGSSREGGGPAGGDG